jgi:hypothetical protein
MFDKIAARREVEERNRLRAASNLPLVTVEEELRRMEEDERQKILDEFIHNSPLRGRVEQKLLNSIRRRLMNPEWRPAGNLSVGGLAFYAAVNNRMRHIWRCRDRKGQA